MAIGVNRSTPPERIPGSYLLRFDLVVGSSIEVGALGMLHLDAGSHYYAGSAFGPGGVAARVARHVAGRGRPHWHVDRLRGLVPVREVWFSYAGRRLEHVWARALLALPGARISAARFGASDCRCPGHLVHFPRSPSRTALATRLGGEGVHRWSVCS